MANSLTSSRARSKSAALYHSRFNMAWVDELRLAPKVILDIGAYDGGDSIRFKSRFPEARIIAFEADPERHAVVAGNVEPLGMTCVNAAVCDQDGPVAWYQAYDARFDDGKAGSQGSMYRHSPECKQRYDFVRQSGTPITVAGMRVDSFCRQAGIDDVDVAHIDAEGAAYDVVAVSGIFCLSCSMSRPRRFSDITDIPAPDGSFDAILCAEVLEHITDPTLALGRAGASAQARRHAHYNGTVL
jgi:FkbM family methyltransferase